MCSKKSLMSFFKNGINKAFKTRKGFLFYKCFSFHHSHFSKDHIVLINDVCPPKFFVRKRLCLKFFISVEA